MNRDKSPLDWDEEYRLFLDSPRKSPPQDMTSYFKKSVDAEFNPSRYLVFTKLFIIHFISGVVTLIFCPQFGFAIHGKSEVLFSFFLRFGEYGCMLACGGLFLGTTGLAAGLLLRAPEVRAIRNSRGLQWALLTFLSVGAFLAFREQEASLPLGLILAWMVGAILGGVSVFQGTYLLRNFVRQRLLIRS